MQVKSGTIYAAVQCSSRTNRTQSPNRQREEIMSRYKIFATTAALLVSGAAVAQDVKVAIGISDDRLCAAHHLQPGGHLQEERPRRDDQEDPQKDGIWPLRQATYSARRPRSKPGILECQWRCDQAVFRSTRATAPMACPRNDLAPSRNKGQDGRRVRARHRALFHLPGCSRRTALGQGRDRGESGATAAVRRHRGGQNDAVHGRMSLSLDGAFCAGQGQDHRHHARLPDDRIRSAARRNSWPTIKSRAALADKLISRRLP